MSKKYIVTSVNGASPENGNVNIDISMVQNEIELDADSWTSYSRIILHNTYDNKTLDSTIDSGVDGVFYKAFDHTIGKFITVYLTDLEEGTYQFIYDEIKDVFIDHKNRIIFPTVADGGSLMAYYANNYFARKPGDRLVITIDHDFYYSQTVTKDVDGNDLSIFNASNGYVTLKRTTNKEIYDACAAAQIQLVTQGNGYFEVRSYGKKPTIDLRCILQFD